MAGSEEVFADRLLLWVSQLSEACGSLNRCGNKPGGVLWKHIGVALKPSVRDRIPDRPSE